MKRIIAVCMLMVLIVSQTACTFSRNNDRAVIPGSSITPAPGAAKEIKGDGENPTLTGVPVSYTHLTLPTICSV